MATLKNNNTKTKKRLTPREFFDKIYGQSNSKSSSNNNNNSLFKNNNIANNQSFQESRKKTNIDDQSDLDAISNRTSQDETSLNEISESFKEVNQDNGNGTSKTKQSKDYHDLALSDTLKTNIKEDHLIRGCASKTTQSLRDCQSHTLERKFKEVNNGQTTKSVQHIDGLANDRIDIEEDTSNGIIDLDNDSSDEEHQVKTCRTNNAENNNKQISRKPISSSSSSEGRAISIVEPQSDDSSLQLTEPGSKFSPSKPESNLEVADYKLCSGASRPDHLDDLDSSFDSCPAKSKASLEGASSKFGPNLAVHSSGVFNFPHHPPGFFNPPQLFTPGVPGQLPIALSAFLARRRKKEGRIRRQRTTFSADQTYHLEVEYQRTEYVARGRRFELAEELRLSETQIKIWFQNRRAKDKRIEKAQIDQQYRNYALVTAGLGGNCGLCFTH